jgi:hypothetical protein
MSQIIIDIGDAPDDGLGTPLRQAFSDINSMFTEVYGAGPVGSNIAIANNTITTSRLNGNIILAPSGIGVTQLNSSAIPRVNDVYDLGSPSLRWNTLYLGTGGFESVGNITGNYFIGNGRLLTGIIAEPGPAIANGTSNITIPIASGPILFKVDTTPNVMVVYSSNVTLARPIIGTTADFTGNVSASYFIGNIIGNISGNFTAPGNNTQVLFNDQGIANATSGFVFDKTSNTVTVTGGILSGNLSITTGNIASLTVNTSAIINQLTVNTTASVTGNITGGNLSTAGNVTANNVLATTITASGNAVIGGNLTVTGNTTFINVQNLNIEDPIVGIGRGANNTPLTVNDGKDRGEQLWYYSGSEKSAFVGYDNSAGNLILATDATVSNEIVSVNNYGNITIGNLQSQYIVATANVTGGNFITSGSITATGNINTSANINASHVEANISGTSLSMSGNIYGNTLFANTAITAFGNVTAEKFIGNLDAAGNLTEVQFFGFNDVISANDQFRYDFNNYVLYVGNGNNGNVVTDNFYSTTKISTGGFVTATGNVTGGNVNTGGLITATGNIIGGNINTAGLITATGNITGGNLSGVGNISGANLVALANISAAGNIFATYFIGNGALLSGIDTTLISNGTSNVKIVSANGNATINIGGTSNVAVFAATGEYITGELSASGNVAGANINTAGLITASGNITSTSNIQGANLITSGNLVYTGGQRIAVSGSDLSAENSTGGGINLLSNAWTQLQYTSDFPNASPYDSANTNWLFVDAGGTTIQSNSTGGGHTWIFQTDGLLTASGNITSNANVQAANLIATSIITAIGNIDSSSNIQGANVVSSGIITATGNITGGNIDTAGLITATGNITSTANVTGGNLVTSGIVTAIGNVIGGNVNTAGRVDATGNVAGGNITTAGRVDASGNVTGANVITAGRFGWNGVGSNSRITNDGSISLVPDTAYDGTAGVLIGGSGFVLGPNGSRNITLNYNNENGLAGAYRLGVVGNQTEAITNYGSNRTGTIGNATTYFGNAYLGNVWTGIIQAANITSTANISGNFVSPGSNREVLFNNNGLISTNSLLTFDSAGPTLALNNTAGTVITAYVSSLGGSDLNITPATNNLVIWGSANPRFSNTYTLGTSSFRWLNVWANNANIVSLSVTGTSTLVGNVAVTANLSAGNISTAGIVTATGNVTGGNLITSGVVTATGNIAGGNINTAGVVTATGNVTGGNLITSGIATVTGNIYGNNLIAASNVEVLGNKITTGTTTGLLFEPGNVSFIAGNIIVNGGYIYSQNGDTAIVLVHNGEIGSVGIANNLQVGQDGVGNLNVAGFANITSDASVGGNTTVTGNVIGGNINTAGIITATGNITGGNIVTSGLVTSTGNIISSANVSAAYIVSANINAPSSSVTITAAAGDNTIFLQPTGNGTVDVNDKRITNVGNPVAADDAVTKQYVDNITSAGLHIHDPVQYESPTALNATYANGGTSVVVDSISGNKTLQFTTSPALSVNDLIVFANSFNGLSAGVAYFVYSTNGSNQVTLSAGYNGTEITTLTNGGPGLAQNALVNSGIGATLTNAGANAALQIDGNSVSVSNRILIYQQANAAHNGVYVVTTVGAPDSPGPGAAWVLTRANDADTYAPNTPNAASVGDYFYVIGGQSGAGESYVLTAPTGAIIFGTSNITYTQFSASQVYSAANGVNLVGTVFSANVDNNTTAILNGNIVVKAGANLTTPNIGAATGTSLSVTGNISSNNIAATNELSGTIVTVTGNITGGNIISNGVASVVGNLSAGNILTNGVAVVQGNIEASGNAIFGQPLSFVAAQANMQYAGTANSYIQLVIQNKDNGVNASTDFVATADNGTDSDTYIDVGINSSQYNQAAYELAGPNDGYLLVYGNTTTGGGQLVLSTFTNKDIVFSTGGGANVNEQGRFQYGNGFKVTGNIYATGNVQAPWFIGNVFGNISGNLVVPGSDTQIVFNDNGVANATSGFTFDKSSNLVTMAGNLVAGNVSTAGLITATGNVTGGNVNTGGLITATGNITSTANVAGGNIVTAGIVTATGNVTGGNITTSGLITATGNVTGGNIDTAGVISATGNITSTANVAGGNIVTAGLVTAIGNVISTANVTGGNLVTSGLVTATGNIISTANVTGGNIVTSGLVTATGNVSGGNITTAGVITATGNIISTANVTGGNITTAGLVTATGNITSTANVEGGNLVTSGIVTSTGNVTGGNITTAGLVTATGNITSTANVAGGNLVTSGIVTATGVVKGQTLQSTNSSGDEGGEISLALAQTNTTLAAGVTIDIFQNRIRFFETGSPFRGAYIDLSTTANTVGTNILAQSVPTALINGNTNLTTAINGNANLTVGGVSNVVVWSSAGQYVNGLISASGNITGDYILGNGACLTGVITSVANINNGTSNIRIDSSGGNILANVSGTANVWKLTPEGEYVTGNIEASGNVTANNFIGNANASSLNSGTIPGARLSGTYNINISGLAATANTVTDAAQPNITSVGILSSLSVSGNVVGGNINTAGLVSSTGNVIAGNVSTAGLITATGNITSTANVAGGNVITTGLVTATGNVTGGNITTAGLITAGGNIVTSGLVTATGNITSTANVAGGNVITTGLVTATGNITSAANVAGGNIVTAGLVTATGNIVSSSNISGENLIANSTVSALGNIISSANIQSNNLSVSNVVSSSNIVASNTIVANGNITGGNIKSNTVIESSGNITAVGNIQGNFFLGNGYYLTGIITSVANINDGTSNIRITTTNGNAAANIAGQANVWVLASTGQYVQGESSASGNVTGGNLVTGGVVTAGGNITGGNVNAGIVSATGNVIGGNVNTGGLITATGNITSTANVIGGNVISNGLITATGNVIGGNITTLGVGTFGTLSVTGDSVLAGNLTVGGTTEYINVTNLNIQDPIIGIGRGANNTPLVTDDGKDRGEQLWYYSGSEKSAFIGYDNSTGKLIAAANVTISNEVVTVNAYGNFVVGGLEATTASTTGNVTGGNIVTTGLVTATGNITSTANVIGGNIITTGQVTATGNITGDYFIGNGAGITGIAVGKLANGNSEIDIPTTNGNITMKVAGEQSVLITDGQMITQISNWANTMGSGNINYAPYTNSMLIGPFTVTDGYTLLVSDNAFLEIY